MYAILDIETTGGQYNQEGITEIAIYKFDGHEVVDQFISLINPEIPIQPFVIKLTGINNAMLRSAPKFYEVAKRIIEITDGTIIIAHNAGFDYRILKTEFNRLGYTFLKETICTVELSKKLIPNMPSYSLGKLVRSLGIPVTDRHRASGDALATLKLFKMLLAKDTSKEILKSFIKTEAKNGLIPKLLDILESLPNKTGIYYIHNEKGEIIAIGKSRNIKKRINQLFTSTSKKAKKIQQEVFAVTFEETGSELIAHLKELEEVTYNKPKYNYHQKKINYPYSFYINKDKTGYNTIYIDKTDNRKKIIASFISMQEARNMLFKLTENHQLCLKINQLFESKNSCYKYKIKECLGACIEQESVETYNQRVEEALKEIAYSNTNMAIIDKGRTIEERSAIIIENNHVLGYCFFNLNYQINQLEILKNILVPLKKNKDLKPLVFNYLSKNKVLKIINY